MLDYPYLDQATRQSLQEDPVKEAIMTELKTILALAQQNHQDTQMILSKLQAEYNIIE